MDQWAGQSAGKKPRARRGCLVWIGVLAILMILGGAGIVFYCSLILRGFPNELPPRAAGSTEKFLVVSGPSDSSPEPADGDGATTGTRGALTATTYEPLIPDTPDIPKPLLEARGELNAIYQKTLQMIADYLKIKDTLKGMNRFLMISAIRNNWGKVSERIRENIWPDWSQPIDNREIFDKMQAIDKWLVLEGLGAIDEMKNAELGYSYAYWYGGLMTEEWHIHKGQPEMIDVGALKKELQAATQREIFYRRRYAAKSPMRVKARMFFEIWKTIYESKNLESEMDAALENGKAK